MKYLAFYTTDHFRDRQLAVSPAGVSKSAYVAQLLRSTGRPVEIVSPCWSKCGRWQAWPAADEPLGDGLTLHQLAAFGVPARWLTPLQWAFALWQVFWYLLRHTRAGEPVAAYHSYYLCLPLLLAKRLRKFRLVLEVEEIYQDIMSLPKPVRRWERAVIRQADAYIFSTAALGQAVQPGAKPTVVINGSYRCAAPADAAPFADGAVHCLYSGTFDPAKEGAYLAIRAAAYLPAAYCVHISGFGTPEQVQQVRQEIARVQQTAACRIVYEGFLDDDAYTALLQKCQIGLNTQTPDKGFSNTCFPSKILTYMAHGLRVVSAANEAITASGVGDLLTYYTAQTPQQIADAVRRVPLDGAQDPRARLQALDAQARQDLQAMLESLA